MVRMSASPSSASATVPSFEAEKNLLLIDTGAEASCCGGGRCGTGIDAAGSTDSTAADESARPAERNNGAD
jgi:hypothetical protein